jgi:hypothetical protein
MVHAIHRYVALDAVGRMKIHGLCGGLLHGQVPGHAHRTRGL